MRVLLPLIACCLLTSAEPLTPAADATAAAQRTAVVLDGRRAYYTWILGGAWRRAGGSADGAEARFLDHLAEHYASPGPTPTWREMAAAARPLLADAGQDPLVRLRAALVLNDEAAAAACAAPLRARQGGAGAYPAPNLVSALIRQMRSRKPEEAAAARAALPEVFAGACAEVLASGQVPRAAAVDHLVDLSDRLLRQDGLDAAGREHLLATVAASTGDRALSCALRGAAAIRDAWRARGNGTANTVTEAGRAGFAAALAVARRELTAAWEELPEAAMAPALMVTVAMGDRNGDTELWFARALAADPACEEAWDRMITASRPRWGGSRKALLELADRAAGLASPTNKLARRADDALSAFVSEGGAEREAWRTVGRLEQASPFPHRPGHDLRRMGTALAAGERGLALDLFARLGGLSTPGEVLAAVPFDRPRAERMLMMRLERLRLGVPDTDVQPIPGEGAALVMRRHAPGAIELLPRWWEERADAGSAWAGRIRTVLAGRADGTGPATAASDLVAAGCSDPAILCLAALASPPGTARRASLMASWDALEQAGYPPLARWQPAWHLMRDLAADERKRLAPRFTLLAEGLADGVGRDGADPGTVTSELGDPPDEDYAMVERLATRPGIPSAVADGLAGLALLGRAERAGQETYERSTAAWQAVARLWRAWTSTSHPRFAAGISTATALAGLPTAESRRWFDLALRRAYDQDFVWQSHLDGMALTGRPDDLLAFAEEIAALPASAGLAARALDPALSVIANRYLHSKERVKKAWSAGGAATAALLADPALAPDRRTHWLHVRLGLAALAGEKAAAEQAARQLGAAYDPKRLPAGIDATKVEPFTSAAEAAEKTTF